MSGARTLAASERDKFFDNSKYHLPCAKSGQHKMEWPFGTGGAFELVILRISYSAKVLLRLVFAVMKLQRMRIASLCRTAIIETKAQSARRTVLSLACAGVRMDSHCCPTAEGELAVEYRIRTARCCSAQPIPNGLKNVAVLIVPKRIPGGRAERFDSLCPTHSERREAVGGIATHARTRQIHTNAVNPVPRDIDGNGNGGSPWALVSTLIANLGGFPVLKDGCEVEHLFRWSVRSAPPIDFGI